MNDNKPSFTEFAALGSGLADRIKLGLFGILAPKSGNSRQSGWRRLMRFIPSRMWLRPKRLGGLQVLIDSSDWSQTVIFEEVFLYSSYDLNKVSFFPEVVIDCGAHIGMFSLLARSRYPLAVLTAYEPNPENGKFIRRQIKKNGLRSSFRPYAVSIESAELSFAASNSHSGRLVSKDSDPLSMGAVHSYTVKAIDFPAELGTMQMKSLLLKMDIEGEERNILPAIMPLLPHQTALFFETHHGAEGWSEIATLLTCNGFVVEQINARGLFYDGFALRS